MAKRKVYIETSVVSYLAAKPSKTIIGSARQQITAAWWEKRAGYQFFVSESVLKECAAGDPDAAARRLKVAQNLPLLMITEDAFQLAQSFLDRKIIPQKAAEDALHISIATIHQVDFLLTWNCKHIANPEIQINISDYLNEIDLFLLFICTPEELLGEESDDL